MIFELYSMKLNQEESFNGYMITATYFVLMGIFLFECFLMTI